MVGVLSAVEVLQGGLECVVEWASDKSRRKRRSKGSLFPNRLHSLEDQQRRLQNGQHPNSPAYQPRTGPSTSPSFPHLLINSSLKLLPPFTCERASTHNCTTATRHTPSCQPSIVRRLAPTSPASPSRPPPLPLRIPRTVSGRGSVRRKTTTTTRRASSGTNRARGGRSSAEKSGRRRRRVLHQRLDVEGAVCAITRGAYLSDRSRPQC